MKTKKLICFIEKLPFEAFNNKKHGSGGLSKPVIAAIILLSISNEDLSDSSFHLGGTEPAFSS